MGKFRRALAVRGFGEWAELSCSKGQSSSVFLRSRFLRALFAGFDGGIYGGKNTFNAHMRAAKHALEQLSDFRSNRMQRLKGQIEQHKMFRTVGESSCFVWLFWGHGKYRDRKFTINRMESVCDSWILVLSGWLVGWLGMNHLILFSQQSAAFFVITYLLLLTYLLTSLLHSSQQWTVHSKVRRKIIIIFICRGGVTRRVNQGSITGAFEGHELAGSYASISSRPLTVKV